MLRIDGIAERGAILQCAIILLVALIVSALRHSLQATDRRFVRLHVFCRSRSARQQRVCRRRNGVELTSQRIKRRSDPRGNRCLTASF